MTRITYKTDLDLPQGIEKYLFNIIRGCIGVEKAIGRARINELLIRYHGIELDDRAMRRVVEKIRNKGIRLCDLENGDGLFIARTEQEYTSFKLRYGKHAFSLIKTIRAMDKGIPVEQLADDYDDVEPMQMALI